MTAGLATTSRRTRAVGPAEGYSNRVFALTLTLAVLAHVLIIIGVHIEPPRPDSRVHSTVEVVVLRQPQAEAAVPDDLAAPAQLTQRGSGQGEADTTRLQAEIDGLPEPVRAGMASLDLDLDTPDRDSQPPEPARPPQDLPTAQPEPNPTPATAVTDPAVQDAAEALTTTLSTPFELTAEPAKQPPAPPPVSAAEILASRNQELARLAARIEERSTVFSDRPRRTSISSSTKEYKYATYLEGWRRKVEQIGNINYPEEARRKHLYGNLILRTAVRADGSVEQIQVLRSSGYPVLDKAAMHIVELAAPFAPFPPDIAAETDVLDITRTWQFQRNNRLGWGN